MPTPDTVPDVVPDTVPPPEPPPVLPDFPDIAPAGWASGVWHWDRLDLLRLPDLSLLQLLERIPGLTPVRPAILGQPEGVALFGAAAGALTFIVDGFRLDPMVSPTFDPSRIPLLALESVRVERRVTGAIVRIESLTPDDPRPQSIIEAGTGDFNTNLFRGMFLHPRILGGTLGLGFERLGTDGFRGATSAQTAGWLRYTVVRDSAGVQLEYRQAEMDRVGVGEDFLGERRDWAARARARRVGVIAEVYAGASTTEDRSGNVTLREGTPQGGLRVHRDHRLVPARTRAAIRLRDHPRLPRQEIELDGWIEPVPGIGLGAAIVQAWWHDARASGHWSAQLRAGPVLGLSAFTAIHRSGAPFGGDDVELRAFRPPDTLALSVARDGLRSGLEFDRWGARVGAAFVLTRADSVPGFALPFDLDAARHPGGEARGIEVVARVPSPWHFLWGEGWFVGMDAPETWPYLPREQWRIGLTYHHRPLPSDNLEIYIRLEHAFRGRMNVPAADAALQSVDRHRATNLEATIRVITVRAFVRWDNMFHRPFQQDLPDFQFPGQRVVYGIKWEFWN